MLSGCGRGSCIRASALVVLVAVSLPVPPLKADAPTLQNRFSLSSLYPCGSGIRSLRACEHRTYARPPLIGSYISDRRPTRRGWRLRRAGWNVPSNTFLLCQIGSSGVLLKSTRGNLLVIPPRLVWRLFRRSRLAIRSRVRFAASRPCPRKPSRLPCAATVAPGGMTTAGDLFKFKTILFL